MAFALGFLAGIPTLILLLQNGLMLGAFAALYASRGLSWDLWGWLLPHGVTELLAVILCGAGGFMLAHAIVMHEDGSVFTHLHPGGTVSMAALERFISRDAGPAAAPAWRTRGWAPRRTTGRGARCGRWRPGRG